jgi:hypothetical protein
MTSEIKERTQETGDFRIIHKKQHALAVINSVKIHLTSELNVDHRSCSNMNTSLNVRMDWNSSIMFAI